MEINHPQLGTFNIIREVGRGSFASVYLARHSTLQYDVALKIFQKDANEEEIYRSFDMTKSIVHPYICQNFDLIKTSNGNNCLIMEYVYGKTLLDYANDRRHLFEQEIKEFFGQIIIAIEYLHKHQIIHRDIKCENIMIDQNKNIRLIDLSFSCPCTNSHSTLCGSPAYLAPEIIERKRYTNSIDIWSLGIIIYAITFGKLPFENKNYSLLFKIITTADPNYPLNTKVSSNLVDLIQKMLIKNPEHRITIDEIKSHSFFANYFDQNNQLLYHDTNYLNYLKQNPELQVIQQMNLKNNELIEAINEIRSDEMTYYKMTFEILYKNFISNNQTANRKYKNKVCDKARSEGDLPLLFDENFPKIDKKKCRYSDLGTHSNSTREFSNNLKENFVHFHRSREQGSHSILINNHVQFRRFSSMHKPIVSVGNKKNILNVKCAKNNMVNNQVIEQKLNVLSHLQTETFEEN